MPPTLKQICAGLHVNALTAHPTLGEIGYYTVAEETASLGVSAPLHRLFAVHAGVVTARAESRRCRVETGGFLWLSAAYRHDLILHKGARVSALGFHLLKNDRPVELEIPFAWFAHGGDAFTLLAQAARDPWGRDDAESRMRLKAWLILLLAAMERWIHRKPEAAFSEGQRMAISDLIAKNARERLSIREIAERLSLSPDYCSRLFTSTYGKSPRRYLLEERMKAIARELAAGAEPIGRVAARYGYESAHSFSRLFKQVLGVSPRASRRAR